MPDAKEMQVDFEDDEDDEAVSWSWDLPRSPLAYSVWR